MYFMEDIFSNVRESILKEGLVIVNEDTNRPWGGFFVISEEQVHHFSELYFDGRVTITEDVMLSPKILCVLPSKRLSWQYHNRRKEHWRVLKGNVGVVRSVNDVESEMYVLGEGDIISLDQRERHRLVGLNKCGVVAEIWEHTDKHTLSDENDIIRLQDDFGR
jgi:mannose-6-phosphate isomerase-like protein (cupin superfamily)